MKQNFQNKDQSVIAVDTNNSSLIWKSYQNTHTACRSKIQSFWMYEMGGTYNYHFVL